MLLIICGLILVSIVLMGLSLSMPQSVTLSPKLKAGLEDKGWAVEAVPKDPPLLKLLPLAPLNRLLLNKKIRQELEDKLFLANKKLTPEGFLSLQELYAAIFVVCAMIIFQKASPLIILFSLGAGFLLPSFTLNSAVSKQKRQILKVFPDTLDLIGLCVGAGLDFVQSLKWIVERCRPNPLTKECARVLRRISMGVSRQDALKSLGKDLNIPEISSFVTTLIQADRMGTPINQILGVLAGEARRKRFARAEREALKAPVKMLFPLIVFILPVIGIIVGGPVMLQFMHSSLPTGAQVK